MIGWAANDNEIVCHLKYYCPPLLNRMSIQEYFFIKPQLLFESDRNKPMSPQGGLLISDDRWRKGGYSMADSRSARFV